MPDPVPSDVSSEDAVDDTTLAVLAGVVLAVVVELALVVLVVVVMRAFQPGYPS
jgi:hypothetical protein